MMPDEKDTTQALKISANNILDKNLLKPDIFDNTKLFWHKAEA